MLPYENIPFLADFSPPDLRNEAKLSKSPLCAPEGLSGLPFPLVKLPLAPRTFWQNLFKIHGDSVILAMRVKVLPYENIPFLAGFSPPDLRNEAKPSKSPLCGPKGLSGAPFPLVKLPLTPHTFWQNLFEICEDPAILALQVKVPPYGT